MPIHQFYPQPAPHGYSFELNKDMTFSSAHFIPNEKAGPCANVHGHNYTVNLTIGGHNLDEMNFLVNFSDLKKVVHNRFDHKLINNELDMPSTEKLAHFIYILVDQYLDSLPNRPFCLQVIVRETDSSYVVYRP